MHEAAHMLLMHPPHPMCGADGTREYVAELEEEANWLGPALLVSEEAALSIAKLGTDLRSAANNFGVSPSLMQMRLNVTGARRRARRALASQ
ncbi:ImmA/IrrE family metallo-endopeptidase [Novosphingopyxis sp.]|uniref:ImmA/IrrE family metallo-endopeptidase n=1 Tax=Novosphingopyxis sp. TaxID=2709690 RepID=UPI003B5A02E8